MQLTLTSIEAQAAHTHQRAAVGPTVERLHSEIAIHSCSVGAFVFKCPVKIQTTGASDVAV